MIIERIKSFTAPRRAREDPAFRLEGEQRASTSVVIASKAKTNFAHAIRYWVPSRSTNGS